MASPRSVLLGDPAACTPHPSASAPVPRLCSETSRGRSILCISAQGWGVTGALSELGVRREEVGGWWLRTERPPSGPGVRLPLGKGKCVCSGGDAGLPKAVLTSGTGLPSASGACAVVMGHSGSPRGPCPDVQRGLWWSELAVCSDWVAGGAVLVLPPPFPDLCRLVVQAGSGLQCLQPGGAGLTDKTTPVCPGSPC